MYKFNFCIQERKWGL
uniref:Uncharacterized protein n=1 Tax=Anguilla anguilla TaxID=7936 RepID=A0A0E9RL08_ANGAN